MHTGGRSLAEAAGSARKLAHSPPQELDTAKNWRRRTSKCCTNSKSYRYRYTMSKVTIRLPGGEWEFDDAAQLGKPGGFGAVFNGSGPDGPVAIKRLHAHADFVAQREMDVNRQLMERHLKHVVPVLDAGQDANSDRYFLVMPVCEGSLQDEISRCSGGVGLRMAEEAVAAIISGLLEVSDLTHRDLKPDNVLRHGGEWKIADFGIAKFVEDTTSLQTLRSGLTPAYGAPEQWLVQRPTEETDVYALGCIIHALVTGQPPFSGDRAELMDHHLRTPPPQLDGISDRIAAFVTLMLRKPQKARPPLARCAQVLVGSNWERVEANSPDNALARAVRTVADREARAEAEERSLMAKAAARKALIEDAGRELARIRSRVFDRIKSQADSAKILRSGALSLGDGAIDIQININALDSSEIGGGLRGPAYYKDVGWDIIAWSRVGVTHGKNDQPATYYWSASLLYADRIWRTKITPRTLQTLPLLSFTVAGKCCLH